ncbi:MAG: EAL domain-containing protein [Pseudomonadota bacterium]
MIRNFSKRFAAASFSSQLTLTLTTGILCVALLSSLAISWWGSHRTRENFVEQGLHITEGFAHQSVLSLLYASGDNAKDAAHATLTFPDATFVEIRDIRNKQLLSLGDQTVLPNDLTNTSNSAATTTTLELETKNAWLFKAPVYAPVNSSGEPSLEAEKTKPELLGYVRVAVSKNTSKKMMLDIFVANAFLSLLFAGGILIVLQFLTRRMTRPLTQLSQAMCLAETDDSKPRADVNGPKEIMMMAQAFNKMMGVLEDRERELRTARDEAIESARAKGEFATTVSHEIRTPMNGVLGTLEILRGMSLSSKQQEYVDLAHSSAEALLALINNILDFSKMEANKLELENVPFDLREIIEQVMALMANETAHKQVALGYVIAPNVPLALCGDPTRLRQLIMNLVGNAIKFTEKGEVAGRISIAEEETNGTVSLTVRISDTGIGVSPDAHARIFESFSQVDSSTTRKYGGSGLGLSICKQIVEALKGKIGLDSVPGKGSTFWFTIPITVQSTYTPELRQHRDMQGKRALLFAQSPIVLDFLTQSLSSWGVSCTSVNDGEQALYFLHNAKKRGEPYAIVITDKDQAGTDVVGFAEQFRADHPDSDTHLLLLTSYVKAHEEALAQQPDADAYINKPLRYGPLLKAVLELLKASPNTATPVRHVRDLQAGRSSGRRILVAEDNRTNQIVATGLLGQLGYVTVIVSNGQEAVEECQKNSYDAILMDCNMPEMDGYQACASIRELENSTGKHIPIIAMTANPKQGEAEKCSAVGMDGHVAKPLTLELVGQALDQCWAKVNGLVGKTPSAAPTIDAQNDAVDTKVSLQLRKALGASWPVMINAFLEDTPVYLDQLRTAVAETDFEAIRSVAHTIAGSSSNLGATKLASLSAKLEDAGRERKYESLTELLYSSIEEYSRVVLALQGETAIYSSENVTIGESEPLILVVDDDRSTRTALRHALENAGFRVEVASNGEEALNMVLNIEPEAILMDALMPVMDGFAATRQLAQMPTCVDIPVLMITKLDDSASIDLAFAAGASDYISKPIHFPVLTQRVKRIVNARRAEKDVRRLAYNDPLTGLPNRVRFIEHVTLCIRQRQNDDQQFALLFLDLDRFKVINDTLGHDIGDQLLKAVGSRIKHVVRGNDQVARLGGDEFTVVLENIAVAKVAAVVAEKICTALIAPFLITGHEIFVKASIGIALYPTDGIDANTLLKRADTAMYRAKRNGTGYFYYEEGMDSTFSKRLLLENALRRAIERNELTVFYQPKFSFKLNCIVGTEALVRWRHPTEGLVSPMDFIPLAEETGLIIPLGEWVLRTACAQVKKWCDEGYAEMSVAVNLSVRQIVQPDFVDVVTRVIEETGIPARLLELELTESVLMEQGKATLLALQQLRKMGITLAIDDFGTGYSSFGYLKRLPVSVLKIDRSFVRDVMTDPDDAAIVSGILALARSLRLEVVAEGVETAEQRAFLQEGGCDMFQGYFLSQPLPAAELEQRMLLTPKIKQPS